MILEFFNTQDLSLNIVQAIVHSTNQFISVLPHEYTVVSQRDFALKYIRISVRFNLNQPTNAGAQKFR